MTLFPETPGAGWMTILMLIIWGVLIFRALRREDRRRLPLRLGLITVAAVSLLAAGLQPRYEVQVDPGAIILATQGAGPAVVDSLTRGTAPDFTAVLDSATAVAFPRARRFYDLEHLLRRHPDIQRIYVAGSGLSAWQLDLIADKTVSFYSGRQPEGILDFRYSRQAPEGKSLYFSGIYRQDKKELRRLFLETPNGKELLLESDSAGDHSFFLETPARQRGRYLFELLVETERRRVLHKAAVPVCIDAARPLRALLLSEAPGFEMKYLKNWLADAGYAVAARSTISRDKFKTEFYNLKNLILNDLGSRLLEDFDVVVIHAAALAELPASHRRALRRAVENGLGLLIMAADGLPNLPAGDRAFFLDFPLRTGAPVFTLSDETAAVELDKAALNIEEAFGIFPLLRTSTGKVVTAWQLRGSGRIGLQLAGATYRLLLEGKEETYSSMWTALLETVARPHLPEVRWTVTDPLLVQPGFPLDMELITSQTPAPGRLVAPDSSASSFYFAQSMLMPESWSARIWPQAKGWHRLDLENSPADSAWFYVPDPRDWEQVRQFRLQRQTEDWVARHSNRSNAAESPVAVSRPYPLWWFYLAFLIAAGGLWLEEKW